MKINRSHERDSAIINGNVGGKQVRIRLDASSMKSVYANAFNVGISREEIVVLLGMGQISLANRKELKICLSDRIVMNPFAAKRLTTLLTRAIRDYEFRFGSLDNLGKGRPEDSTTH
jgi:hypothetical protein